MTNGWYFFLFFPENWIWQFLQIISIRDTLHDISNPVSWEKKKKKKKNSKCHLLTILPRVLSVTLHYQNWIVWENFRWKVWINGKKKNYFLVSNMFHCSLVYCRIPKCCANIPSSKTLYSPTKVWAVFIIFYWKQLCHHTVHVHRYVNQNPGWSHNHLRLSK